jgi:DNA-binding response OmpR family regulator
MTTIMVLESDVLVRTAISEHLRDCGYRVIEAVRAADVWAAAQAGTVPDVVFAGVRAGGDGGGFSLAQQLRQTHPGISVILTSGIADAAQKSSELCEQGAVEKPYRPQDLARRIHLLIERRRSSQQSPDE